MRGPKNITMIKARSVSLVDIDWQIDTIKRITQKLAKKISERKKSCGRKLGAIFLAISKGTDLSIEDTKRVNGSRTIMTKNKVKTRVTKISLQCSLKLTIKNARTN
jgi:hypothetical protein